MSETKTAKSELTLLEPVSTLTIDMIRNGDRRGIIHQIVQRLDNQQTIDPNIVKALFSRATEDTYNRNLKDQANSGQQKWTNLKPGNYTPYPEINNGSPITPQLLPHHPEFFSQENTTKFPDPADIFHVSPGTSTTFPKGLADCESSLVYQKSGETQIQPIQDAIQKIAITAFKRLNSSQQLDVFIWGFELFRNSDINRCYRAAYIPDIICQLNQLPPQTQEQITDFILQQPKNKQFFNTTQPRSCNDAVGDITQQLMEQHPQLVLNRVSQQSNTSEKKEQLGYLIFITDFPSIANQIRASIENAPDQETKQLFESLGRTLLGIPDELTFHTSLESIYQKLEFEKYPPNQRANQFELQTIAQVITQTPYPEGTIIDLGTGTGRIANGLKQRFPQETIIGIDISPTNIQKAKQTGQAEFLEASWLNLPQRPNSVRMVTSTGRSLCHAEDEETFTKIIKQVSHCLKPGGRFFFDMPNPEKGTYKANQHKSRQILINLGCSPKYANQLPYTIDSADGRNLYNRYTPTIQKVIYALDNAHFEVKIVAVKQINDTGDETVYFLAKKKGRRFQPRHHHFSYKYQTIWPKPIDLDKILPPTTTY